MDKKTMAASAVVAIAVVCVAVFVAMGGMGGGGSEEHKEGSLVGNVVSGDGIPSYDSRLWVYGNANEDDRIDIDDVTAIENIVAGKTKGTVLADANADGIVDSKDADFVKGIIAGNDMNVYYVDNYFKVAKVAWPVETIAIGYCSGAYVADVTGLCDKVTMVDETIDTYWNQMNSNFKSAASFGATEEPDYEAMIAKGIDVYVVGYCDATADPLSPGKLNPAGIDVMFMSTADNASIPYPNEFIDRSIVMFSFLLQGDMEKTYKYLAWHDDVLGKLKTAGATISEEDRAAFMMARESLSYKTDGLVSITGLNNTNNIHAEWVGVYAVGQHDSALPKNYNKIDAETILSIVDRNARDNTLYYMDNEHDGMRQQRLLEDCIPADIEMLKSSDVDIHYMGMAREAGNSPMYVVELAFYQNVMYPELNAQSGLDYKELFQYYFDNFASEDYYSDLDIEDFFWDCGTA